MLNELISTNNQFVEIMKKQKGVLGAWYFGSMAHDTVDDLSDIDIIFLIEENSFAQTDARLDSLLLDACDEILLRWDESFNSNAIKNYGYLIKHNGKIFQYDVFLLNQGLINDFMCRIHYTELKSSDVIFDKDGSVEALIDLAVTGSPWQSDMRYLITTYWFHVQMSTKYFLREDYFKLENVLRILMDTHTSLLLSAYDNTTWGGSQSKLHFIPKDKQEHLMLYGCTKDFDLVQKNLYQSMKWFDEDLREIVQDEILAYHNHLSSKIMSDWIN